MKPSESGPSDTAPVVGRRERRRLQTRERIVEVATELFERQGYDATHVLEIADVVNIAKATFFSHFPTKLDLLREIAVRAVLEAAEAIEEVAKRDAPLRERLVAVFEDMPERSGWFTAPQQRLFNSLHTSILPETAEQDQRRFHEIFERLLAEGIGTGEVRTDVSLEAMVGVVLGTWWHLFDSWGLIEGFPLRARVRETAQLVADTVCVPAAASMREPKS